MVLKSVTGFGCFLEGELLAHLLTAQEQAVLGADSLNRSV